MRPTSDNLTKSTLKQKKFWRESTKKAGTDRGPARVFVVLYWIALEANPQKELLTLFWFWNTLVCNDTTRFLPIRASPTIGVFIDEF